MIDNAYDYLNPDNQHEHECAHCGKPCEHVYCSKECYKYDVE